jgi:hypothetical protein
MAALVVAGITTLCRQHSLLGVGSSGCVTVTTDLSGRTLAILPRLVRFLHLSNGATHAQLTLQRLNCRLDGARIHTFTLPFKRLPLFKPSLAKSEAGARAHHQLMPRLPLLTTLAAHEPRTH